MGDLGTHCFHLSEFVSGRRVTALAANLQTMVPGRRLEDNAHILLRYDNGARGRDVGFGGGSRRAGGSAAPRLRREGSHCLGAERSRQADLCLARRGIPPARARPERSFIRRQARDAHVAGLPEGYFEAFATLYRDYADILSARKAGSKPDPLALWVPMVEEGARGMAFVEAALSSHAEGGRWVDFLPEI